MECVPAVLLPRLKAMLFGRYRDQLDESGLLVLKKELRDARRAGIEPLEVTLPFSLRGTTQSRGSQKRRRNGIRRGRRREEEERERESEKRGREREGERERVAVRPGARGERKTHANGPGRSSSRSSSSGSSRDEWERRRQKVMRRREANRRMRGRRSPSSSCSRSSANSSFDDERELEREVGDLEAEIARLQEKLSAKRRNWRRLGARSEKLHDPPLMKAILMPRF
jgi:hypothetical protein